ncbi:MAG: LD-carboxypeptidase [Candidatus Omnitrophica bacterium]|nr:LD-carboxypeptidase [Candidatus Omnitrophota bacterium]MBU1925901.1 LD-carboxypeptidase [Candidatus Omnitrophota bacterium]
MQKIAPIKPGRLVKGDTIGIVAPSSSFDRDNFKKGVAMLRSLGYAVKYERSIFNACWSKPGHNKQRALQINRMFADTQVKAIFCAKAGTGSAEIIPYLDKKIIRNNPKIFVGYSDITVILLYLQKIANMVVFHGPIVSDEIYHDMNQLTLEYLQALCGQAKPLGELKVLQLIAFRQGRASGRLAGGNLSLIVEAMDLPYRVATRGCILFLEDINESFETMQQYFVRLRRAGIFKKIAGLVFGKITDPAGKEHDIRGIVDEIFKGYNIPILYGFPSGHLQLRGGLHITLPFGVLATIDSEALSLTIDEAAVT